MTLYLGDCLEVMDEIPDGSIDMVLADPPFGITACKWDSVIDLDLMWSQLKRVIKPNGAIVLHASQPFTTTLISSNKKMFKYCWVWEKEISTNFLHAKRQPLRKHEDLVVFYSKQPTYNPQRAKGKPYKKTSYPGSYGSQATNGAVINGGYTSVCDGGRYPVSIQKFNTNRGLHPTQKPVPLAEYLIKTYTQPSETVLDFCMGSGTTGIACQNLDREFIGIEKDQDYYQLAVDRIKSNEQKTIQSLRSKA